MRFNSDFLLLLTEVHYSLQLNFGCVKHQFQVRKLDNYLNCLEKMLILLNNPSIQASKYCTKSVENVPLVVIKVHCNAANCYADLRKS